MSYYSDWLYVEAVKVLKSQTGIESLEEDESKFLKNYFNPLLNENSKLVFYEAVYKLRRFYPRFLVFYAIKRRMRKDFKTLDAPESIYKIVDAYSEHMFFNALKAYCKIKD